MAVYICVYGCTIIENRLSFHFRSRRLKVRLERHIYTPAPQVVVDHYGQYNVTTCPAANERAELPELNRVPWLVEHEPCQLLMLSVGVVNGRDPYGSPIQTEGTRASGRPLFYDWTHTLLSLTTLPMQRHRSHVVMAYTLQSCRFLESELNPREYIPSKCLNHHLATMTLKYDHFCGTMIIESSSTDSITEIFAHRPIYVGIPKSI